MLTCAKDLSSVLLSKDNSWKGLLKKAEDKLCTQQRGKKAALCRWLAEFLHDEDFASHIRALQAYHRHLYSLS